MSKLPNSCCQTLERIIDSNPEISQMNLQEFNIFRYTFASWIALYQKKIQGCEFCWPFFKDVIYPSIISLPYHRTIILQRRGQKALTIEIVIGFLGIRYCISCSIKKQDFTPKKLFMSRNETKMCLICSYSRIKSLTEQINQDVTIKDEKGTVLDKSKLSKELMEELEFHWLRESD